MFIIIKKKTGFKLVSNYFKEYKKIFSKFKPSKILIYNTSNIDNQCLIDIALSANYQIDIFQYQNGREALNIKDNQFYLNLTEARVMSNRIQALKELSEISIKSCGNKTTIKVLLLFQNCSCFAQW